MIDDMCVCRMCLCVRVCVLDVLCVFICDCCCGGVVCVGCL